MPMPPSNLDNYYHIPTYQTYGLGSCPYIGMKSLLINLFQYYNSLNPAATTGPKPPPYTASKIPKGKHGWRRLEVPHPDLAILQKEILVNVFYPLLTDRLHPASAGFCPGNSCSKAATRHVGHKYLIKMDISNFFPSITDQMVGEALAPMLRKLMTTFVPAADVEEISFQALIAAQYLMTFRGRLPQGAPTSPFLSNLVFASVDAQIAEEARIHGFEYSRYADDITLSGNANRMTCQILVKKIRKILFKNKFKPNDRKTQITHNSQQQLVLGITVNEKLSIPKKGRRLVRAALYNLKKSGMREPLQVRGLLSYLRSVNREQADKLVRDYNRAVVRKDGRNDPEKFDQARDLIVELGNEDQVGGQGAQDKETD